ncbi:hypothetical protein [Mesorhizobium sp.]|uniref:hypothetical protein n=1 Tax=Mesorhizobium sp. TaxID=1871066 RepID=UPI00257DA3D3|nr:hypothetical protein [Mesorhizobium sp.]
MANSHRAKLMQPEPEAGYDTEIPTATADTPKKLRIYCRIDPVHAAVGRSISTPIKLSIVSP